VKANTKGAYLRAPPGWTIIGMDSHLNTLLVADHINRRIARADGERHARSIKPRRHWLRRGATVQRPAPAPRVTITPS
jgi:hypothetical protein